MSLEQTGRDPNKEWSVSPSQLEKFDSDREGCNRKWGFDYIGGHKQPQAASAALGEGTHHVLEAYLEKGELPDQNTREGQIATAGLHLLPDPLSPTISHLSVEGKINFRSEAGHLYGGRVDFQYWEHVDGAWRYVIGDHKTTSNWRWMKHPDKLQDDTQALIYAKSVLVEYPQLDSVTLRWIYYITRGAPQARESSLTLTREQVEHKFQRIERVAEKVHLAIATVTDPLQLEPNTNACERFGGCPYRHLCTEITPISISERFQSYMNLPGLPGLPGLPSLPAAAPPAIPAETAALLAQLQAQQVQQAAVPTPPPAQPSILQALQTLQAAAPVALPVAPPPPAPTNFTMPAPGVPVVTAGTWYDPTAAGDVKGYMYSCHCNAQVAAPVVHQNSGRCPNCNRQVAGAEIIGAAFDPIAPVIPAAINPPEAVQAVATAAAPIALPVPPTPSLPIIGGVATLSAPTFAIPAGPPPNPAVEEKKTGRGRPVGSKNASKSGDDATSMQTATWAEELITPVQFNHIKVGPFTATGYPREGETEIMCLARLNNELASFAEQERSRKIQSFVVALPKGP